MRRPWRTTAPMRGSVWRPELAERGGRRGTSAARASRRAAPTRRSAGDPDSCGTRGGTTAWSASAAGADTSIGWRPGLVRHPWRDNGVVGLCGRRRRVLRPETRTRAAPVAGRRRGRPRRPAPTGRSAGDPDSRGTRGGTTAWSASAAGADTWIGRRPELAGRGGRSGTFSPVRARGSATPTRAPPEFQARAAAWRDNGVVGPGGRGPRVDRTECPALCPSLGPRRHICHARLSGRRRSGSPLRLA